MLVVAHEPMRLKRKSLQPDFDLRLVMQLLAAQDQ
jgi:hypothetical protein